MTELVDTSLGPKHWYSDWYSRTQTPGFHLLPYGSYPTANKTPYGPYRHGITNAYHSEEVCENGKCS